MNELKLEEKFESCALLFYAYLLSAFFFVYPKEAVKKN
jgi:hypothetical protein